MKSKVKSILINAPQEKVFAYMDQLGNTGTHMTQSSMPMMGGKLSLVQLSDNALGLGSSYRWYGKIIGFKLDFMVVVTQWEQGKRKVWETTGEAKMVILRWYRMYLALAPKGRATLVTLGIDYEKPKNLFFWLVALILAPWYANWCITSILDDSKTVLEHVQYDEYVEALHI